MQFGPIQKSELKKLCEKLKQQRISFETTASDSPAEPGFELLSIDEKTLSERRADLYRIGFAIGPDGTIYADRPFLCPRCDQNLGLKPGYCDLHRDDEPVKETLEAAGKSIKRALNGSTWDKFLNILLGRS